MLKSLNLGVAEVEPQQLIAIIDDLTSPTTAPQDDAVPYNPNDPIAAQAIRHDIELVVLEDRMRLVTERFRATARSRTAFPRSARSIPMPSTCGILPRATCPSAGRRGNARG
jgi:conjugal transfer ATP-binding protein TraC